MQLAAESRSLRVHDGLFYCPWTPFVGSSIVVYLGEVGDVEMSVVCVSGKPSCSSEVLRAIDTHDPTDGPLGLGAEQKRGLAHGRKLKGESSQALSTIKPYQAQAWAPLIPGVQDAIGCPDVRNVSFSVTDE